RRAAPAGGAWAAAALVAPVRPPPPPPPPADAAALASPPRLAGEPGVVALGETGLDFHYDHSPRPAQRTAFARTVQLARTLRLPVVIHVREAHVEAVDILRAEGTAPIDGVIHCFTGGRDDARRYLGLGRRVSV